MSELQAALARRRILNEEVDAVAVSHETPAEEVESEKGGGALHSSSLPSSVTITPSISLTSNSSNHDDLIVTSGQGGKPPSSWYPGKYIGIKSKPIAKIDEGKNEDELHDQWDDILLEKDSFLDEIQKLATLPAPPIAIVERLPGDDSDETDARDLRASNLELKMQVKYLQSEVRKKDIRITSLEEQIVSLKSELVSAQDPRLSITPNKRSGDNLASLENSPADRLAKPSSKPTPSSASRRTSTFQSKLKLYGFDFNVSEMTISEAELDEASLIVRSSLTSMDLPELTPSANKQLLDLLNLDAATNQSSKAKRLSLESSTSSRALTSSSISTLSREPSTKFIDPLAFLAAKQEHRKDETELETPQKTSIADLPEPAQSHKHNDEISYTEFCQRMMRVECDDLTTSIRRFLSSVYGPEKDGKPPSRNTQVDYIFYGSKKLVKRCREFFDNMQMRFRGHPSWRDESEDFIFSSRDCLEQYVMTRISDFAFKETECAKEDEFVLRRMKLLAFLEPENLDIKHELRKEAMWQVAVDELRKMSAARSPSDKIAQVVKCASVIFSSIEIANRETGVQEGGGGIGADDFLPIFILVVLRSQVPQLASNCAYINAYLNPIRLMGQAGYYLTNLESAMEYLCRLDHDTLSSIDESSFRARISEAEKSLATSK